MCKSLQTHRSRQPWRQKIIKCSAAAMGENTSDVAIPTILPRLSIDPLNTNTLMNFPPTLLCMAFFDVFLNILHGETGQCTNMSIHFEPDSPQRILRESARALHKHLPPLCIRTSCNMVNGIHHINIHFSVTVQFTASPESRSCYFRLIFK